MRGSSLVILPALVVALFLSQGANACDSIPAPFPTITGWTRDGERECYQRENLFDYVDGAAELYLSYQFVEAAAEYFNNGRGDYMTIDVFSFETERDAFGMYSRERPREAEGVPVGVEAYVHNGVLGFCKGSYYVKLTGSSVGDSLEQVLMRQADHLAAFLSGTNAFPPPVTWFPETGKMARSEQYISRDFLGHSFLTSVYVAEYSSDTGPFRAFIVEAESPADAAERVAHYRTVTNAPGSASTGSEPVRIVDPYHESAGPLHLQQRGRYVVGVFNDDPLVCESLLEEIAEHITLEG